MCCGGVEGWRGGGVEGDIWVHSIAELGFFQALFWLFKFQFQYAVLQCHLALLYAFSILLADGKFGKRRLFTILRYGSLIMCFDLLSNTGEYNNVTQNKVIFKA